MKLYRHYKNKPYKFVGTAKHSETLEDMVIYECLYDNPSAKVWVRPKGMFFENVDIGGRMKPRFEKIPLRLDSTTEITSTMVSILAPLVASIFGEWNPQRFTSVLNNHRKFHLVTAWIEDKLVAYKIGYEKDKTCFYSWGGGVLPEHRGLGIAKTLMTAQHDWCREQGYKKIQTKTRNKFKDMLLLNIKSGFDIIGTQTTESDGLKILLEKKLS